MLEVQASSFFEYLFFSDNVVDIDFESFDSKETVALLLEYIIGGSTYDHFKIVLL
jgi:hypothetical protein